MAREKDGWVKICQTFQLAPVGTRPSPLSNRKEGFTNQGKQQQ